MGAIVLKRVRARRGNVRVGSQIKRGVEFFGEHSSGRVNGVVEELCCGPNTVISGSDFSA
jgi:hypothetical protein